MYLFQCVCTFLFTSSAMCNKDLINIFCFSPISCFRFSTRPSRDEFKPSQFKVFVYWLLVCLFVAWNVRSSVYHCNRITFIIFCLFCLSDRTAFLNFNFLKLMTCNFKYSRIHVQRHIITLERHIYCYYYYYSCIFIWIKKKHCACALRKRKPYLR